MSSWVWRPQPASRHRALPPARPPTLRRRPPLASRLLFLSVCAQGLPYSINGVGDLLALFRCISCKYKFATDASKPQQMGAVGRVYASGEPEMSHNIQRYDKQVYLRVAEAQVRSGCGCCCGGGMTMQCWLRPVLQVLSVDAPVIASSRRSESSELVLTALPACPATATAAALPRALHALHAHLWHAHARRLPGRL